MRHVIKREQRAAPLRALREAQIQRRFVGFAADLTSQAGYQITGNLAQQTFHDRTSLVVADHKVGRALHFIQHVEVIGQDPCIKQGVTQRCQRIRVIIDPRSSTLWFSSVTPALRNCAILARSGGSISLA